MKIQRGKFYIFAIISFLQVPKRISILFRNQLNVIILDMQENKLKMRAGLMYWKEWNLGANGVGRQNPLLFRLFISTKGL